MDFTVLVLPEGKDLMVSPTLTIPEATLPQKPRKSKFGRLTYCTGKRKSVKFLSAATGTDSKISIKVWPLYQGARSERLTTLSPSNAEIGTKKIFSVPNFSANCRYCAL